MWHPFHRVRCSHANVQAAGSLQQPWGCCSRLGCGCGWGTKGFWEDAVGVMISGRPQGGFAAACVVGTAPLPHPAAWGWGGCDGWHAAGAGLCSQAYAPSTTSSAVVIGLNSRLSLSHTQAIRPCGEVVHARWATEALTHAPARWRGRH